MKKLTGLILLALMISFTACQEETMETTDNAVVNMEKTATFNENVSVQDNMLYFASVEDYENTIAYLWELGDENFAKWEESLSFNSMRKMISEEEREKIGIADDLFATLLNPNGMIHIAEHVFQIDVKNESVFAVKDEYYKSITGENFNITNTTDQIQSFSIDDDIIGILEGTTSEKTEKGFCKGQKKDGDLYDEIISYKLVYQRGGLYRSLQSKIKRPSWSDDFFHIYLTSHSGNWYKHKIGTYSIPYKHIGGQYSREYNYRPYGGWGVRRLKGYYFKVTFKAEQYDENGNYYNSQQKTIYISC